MILLLNLKVQLFKMLRVIPRISFTSIRNLNLDDNEYSWHKKRFLIKQFSFYVAI